MQPASPDPTLYMMPVAQATQTDPSPLPATVEAVVFDLDDTLCAYWDAAKAGILEAFALHGPAGRTPEAWVAVWGEAFHEFCPNLKQTDWYVRYLKSGATTRTELMRRALARGGVQDEAVAQALSAAYADRRNAHLRLFDDALAVLRALKKGHKLALMTNGPADVQRQEIETLGIGGFFDAFFIEGEFGEGKPSPRVFKSAEQVLGTSSERMLFVGNSYKHDIEPALAMGWSAAWIQRPSDVAPSSKTGLPESKPEGRPEPTVRLSHLSELLPMLGLA